MSRRHLFSSLTVIISLLIVFSASGWANTRLFSSIQQICTAYQVKISNDDITMITHEDGSKELTINAQSGRNDFDRVMLIAFYAAGKAMKYHKVMVSHVTIIVSVEYKDAASVLATATIDDINRYVDGSCSSSDFVRRLKFS